MRPVRKHINIPELFQITRKTEHNRSNKRCLAQLPRIPRGIVPTLDSCQGQSEELHPYCLMRVGERELFRTRPLRFGHDMTWERPEERFRLPLADLWQGSQIACGADATREMSAAATDNGASCSGGPGKRSPLARSELFRRGGAKDGAEDDKGKKDTDVGATDGTEVGAITGRYPCSTPLTLEVWGEEVSGNRREFFGSARLSLRDMEHPPGDLWLPLEGTTRVDNRDSGSHGADEGGEGGTGVGAAVRSESGGAAASDGETWVEGLLRTVRRVRRGDRRKQSVAWVPGPATGSVHLWLGRARRSSPGGLEPGEGAVVFQVHGVTGLRQVRGAYDASLVREVRRRDCLQGTSIAWPFQLHEAHGAEPWRWACWHLSVSVASVSSRSFDNSSCERCEASL